MGLVDGEGLTFGHYVHPSFIRESILQFEPLPQGTSLCSLMGRCGGNKDKAPCLKSGGKSKM